MSADRTPTLGSRIASSQTHPPTTLRLVSFESLFNMKKVPRKSRAPDKDLHIPKRVAGGATGLALGAMVGGPVGAIIGGMAGAMVGSAAERHSGTADLPILMKKSVKKLHRGTRATMGKGKTARVRNKSAVRKNKGSVRLARRGSKTSTKKV